MLTIIILQGKLKKQKFVLKISKSFFFWAVLLSTAQFQLIRADVKITPPGPVITKFRQKIKFELQCSSRFNITWDLPILNFSELNDQGVLNIT